VGGDLTKSKNMPCLGCFVVQPMRHQRDKHCPIWAMDNRVFSSSLFEMSFLTWITVVVDSCSIRKIMPYMDNRVCYFQFHSKCHALHGEPGSPWLLVPVVFERSSLAWITVMIACIFFERSFLTWLTVKFASKLFRKVTPYMDNRGVCFQCDSKGHSLHG
jgi:hypothetical protein